MSRPPLARLRSLLFAPGNRPEVLAKLPRSEPDAAAIDLEDAVAPLAKEAARATARSAAEELAAEHPGLGLFIRVNAVPTEWFAADVAEALSPVLHGVLVPKLESADQVTQVVAALDAQGLGSLGIVAGLESAAGVERATEIVGASPRVVAAYFGAEDYVADLGGVRTVGNDEVLYARSRVVLATRLASVRSLDIVVSDFSDEERFRADAAQGRALGYTGKLCIHPAQVGWANELFAPSPAQLER
ncbi:MAG: CoA ester lyase, partial [Acidimicrobiales bacterium]|nr:CoA ester lyase [Acidimicrobiales bacterium]